MYSEPQTSSRYYKAHTSKYRSDELQYCACHHISPFLLLKLCLPSSLGFVTLSLGGGKESISTCLCKKDWCLGPTPERFWLTGLRYVGVVKSSPGDFNLQSRLSTAALANISSINPGLSCFLFSKCCNSQSTVLLHTILTANKQASASRFLILQECSVRACCLSILSFPSYIYL